MSARSILILFLFVFLIVSCSAEPETVIETVLQEATVEVEVEVTRIVKREVEVEVTREVEITRVVELEVTRIVEIEQIVTATPEPTVEPTPEPTIEPTPKPTLAPTTAPTTADDAAPAVPAPAQAASSNLLDQMVTTRGQIQSFGGMIDGALGGAPTSCFDLLYLYETIVASPTMDVSSATPEEQNAYGHYRASIDIFRDGARDMAGNCRDLINNPDKESTTIAPQQWTLARVAVNSAVDTIHPGIQLLGGE